MDQLVIPQVKRRGNPNFGKKSTTSIEQVTPEADHNKQYIFQLLKTHDKAKPVDSKTGEVMGSPYQPFYGIVNSGMAWDPDYIPPSEEKKALLNPSYKPKPGAQRRWRYVYNFPTIWVDEQVNPEPTKEEISAEQNDLIFKKGILRVFGHETMKLKALFLNDTFQDCERPLKNLPKEYMLLDQDKIDREVMQALDESFEAEKSAREASLQDMYSTAYYFGIDLTKSDDAIRKAFIGVARSKPAVFNREFVNPKNKYKYTMLEGLSENIISPSHIPGKLCFVETGAPILDLKTNDAAEEVASMAMGGFTPAINAINKVRAILDGEK